ncbi:hypothetical protein [Paenarthrobacter sp. NPDC018779]|uniref:hypothetical protein n=1 Tax=Paenarthrobacter sp. NPDC018779 TaxID=3364375 RepID=UPI0037C8BE7F
MVERSIAWLTRGNRRVRHRGISRNNVWLQLRIAGLNLGRLLNLGLTEAERYPTIRSTCAGQATTPIVAAISSIVPVDYAEIVASIASKSAGPGTRANVDEFTETTAEALQVVGGAKQGKAIIIINPVEPPMIMRNTIYCAIPAEAAEPGPTRERIRAAIAEAVERTREYVPGYELRVEPQFDSSRDDWNGAGRVGVWVQVKGAADYLPEYAGNLDIITAAATRTADLLAEKMDESELVTASTENTGSQS